MEVFEILEQARQIEALAATTYRAAAERFAGDDRWNRAFLQLAAEEDQHALRVKMLGSRLTSDRRAFREAELEGVDFGVLLDRGASFLERLQRPGVLTLDDTLEQLAAMEEAFAGAHAHVMLASADPSARSFFEQLAAQDKAHRQLLGHRTADSPAT